MHCALKCETRALRLRNVYRTCSVGCWHIAELDKSHPNRVTFFRMTFLQQNLTIRMCQAYEGVLYLRFVFGANYRQCIAAIHGMAVGLVLYNRRCLVLAGPFA